MLQTGMRPDVVSFSTVIHAYARAGDVESAEAWFLQMLTEGVEANVISYNSVMDACAKAGHT